MNGKIMAGVIGLLAVISSLQANLNKTSYEVARVIDGDTFETVDRSIIRFDTLDAPMLVNCGGVEAKKELEKLISGKRVYLNVQARDVNGRQIASVWVGDMWVDQKLIASGWVAYSSSALDKDHVLKNLDLANREKKLGIYSDKCTQYVNTENPKCQIKGNIIGEWLKKGQKAYHFPGCIQYKTTRIEKYRGEQWFCTEAEAEAAGYTKSGGCGTKSWKL